MRAIDANVILRYFLRDNHDLWQRATVLIESPEVLGLTPVALAEVAWTLAGPTYALDRTAVASELITLLTRQNVEPLGFDKAEGYAALLTCLPPQCQADFGDALIAASARSFGVNEIYSFDQRFARAGLTPVPPP